MTFINKNSDDPFWLTKSFLLYNKSLLPLLLCIIPVVLIHAYVSRNKQNEIETQYFSKEEIDSLGLIFYTGKPQTIHKLFLLTFRPVKSPKSRNWYCVDKYHKEIPIPEKRFNTPYTFRKWFCATGFIYKILTNLIILLLARNFLEFFGQNDNVNNGGTNTSQWRKKVIYVHNCTFKKMSKIRKLV